MIADFNAKLSKQMEDVRSKFIEEKTAHLNAQCVDLERSQARLVQKKVEFEAGGRFGGLDNLTAWLAVLENYGYEAA